MTSVQTSTPHQASRSLIETTQFNLARAAERLGLDDAMHHRLAEPKEKIELTAHPDLGGDLAHVHLFVVRYNDALGPAKGGIRMSPTVQLDDIVGLAMEMTWKTALIGVPFGGGKSGIQCDPASLTAQQKEIIIRSFTRTASRHIGPEIYVPAPDMGTNERDMGHIRDCISYSQGVSITAGCYVTGKPVLLGGIIGRREATGNGVIFATQAACEQQGFTLAGARVAVQGFGNVGSVAALAASRAGARVVAVSDVHGGVINQAGLDIEALMRHVAEAGTVQGFPGAEAATNAEVLECECDILIPAASQSQLTEANADRVRARMVAEGANSPVTPEADDILSERGVYIIPDILCNAGGVFVSYLEYTQETQREQYTLEEVNRRLAARMREKFAAVSAYAGKRGGTMRQAAMDLAVTAVVETIVARGFQP